MMRGAIPSIIERRPAGQDVSAKSVVAHIQFNLLQASLCDERSNRMDERVKSLGTESSRDTDQGVFTNTHVVKPGRKTILESAEQIMADVSEDDDYALVIRG